MSGHLLFVVGAIATPHIRYLAILPEIVMLGGAVVLLGVGSLVARELRARVATVATVAISGGSLGVALWQWADVTSHGPYTAIDHALAVDGFSSLICILVACAMLLTALVADGYLRREGTRGVEMHVLAMASSTGAMVMGSANDLIVVFLGLEILSIALYVLTAMNHRRSASGEASLKYFIVGSFSSAVFIYGIALVYGATGTTNIAQLAHFLATNVLASDGLLLAGMALLVVGFAFKTATVPFHMWTPDVYQGAPSPMTGFMAAIAKVGAFAAFLRVFVSSFGVLRADWQPIVYALAIVTLVVGAGLGVMQRDVKRMLAYSSINHAGFVLVALEAASRRGVSAVLYYLVAYVFMIVGSFAVVTVLGRRGDGAHDLAHYRGLALRQPVLALAFAVLLLAQAGVPFTTGLWAKVQVVLAASHHAIPLAIIAMVSAALAGYYYLRVAVLMYSPRPEKGVAPGVQEPAEDPAALPMGARTNGQGTAALSPAGAVSPQALEEQAALERLLWAGTEGSVAVATELNAGVLLDADVLVRVPATQGSFAVDLDNLVSGLEAGDEVEVEPTDARVPVPVLGAVAIGLCVAVTVVFGFWPAPLTSFAHHATLLFMP